MSSWGSRNNNNGYSQTTTADSGISTEKYCTICQKTCGHWAHEHDLVFDGEEK